MICPSGVSASRYVGSAFAGASRRMPPSSLPAPTPPPSRSMVHHIRPPYHHRLVDLKHEPAIRHSLRKPVHEEGGRGEVRAAGCREGRVTEDAG